MSAIATATPSHALDVLVPIAATGLGLGAVGIASWVRSLGAGKQPSVPVPKPNQAKPVSIRIAVALGAGILVGLATHIVVAGFASVAAAWFLPPLFGHGKSARVIEKREAVIEWASAVRDLLAGGTALQGALLAGCHEAPLVIETELSGFAADLSGGGSLGVALSHLAGTLDDPVSDTVVAGLILAATTRGEKVADLLDSLIEQASGEVAALRAVEADRAKPRSSMRFVVSFSVGVAVLLFSLGSHYAAPYRSATGEMVLGLVAAIYALGIWLMDQMTRPEAGPRLGLVASPSHRGTTAESSRSGRVLR